MVNLLNAQGWQRAELHCHSTSNRLSYFPWFYDAVQSVEEIIAQCLKLNIKILSITEHDSLNGFKKAKEFVDKFNLDMIIVPGMEISTIKGHMLAYGINEEIYKKQTPEETIKQIHQQGGIAIAAHTFGPMGLGNLVENLEIDGLEIGSLLTKRWNTKTARIADKLGISLIAGSDAHMVEDIGLGMTLFPPKVDKWEEVIECIKNGNISYESKKGKWLPSLKKHVKRNFRIAKKNGFKIRD